MSCRDCSRWCGTWCFPPDTRVELELLEERRFTNGAVFLRYRHRT